MIQIKNFFLRAIEEEDLLWMKDLRNDEKIWSNLGNFVFLNNYHQKKWYESINNKNNVLYLIFGYKKQNLGIVRITDIDRINRSMCVGGDILSKYHGHGYAKYMYQLIFKLGFDTWGMHRLWLLVLANNRIAKHVYLKMGFIEEGRQRSAIYKKGKFLDYIMMSILDNEYKKIK